MPPYLIVLWTSATIDPMYLAPYAFGLKKVIFEMRPNLFKYYYIIQNIVRQQYLFKVMAGCQ